MRQPDGLLDNRWLLGRRMIVKAILVLATGGSAMILQKVWKHIVPASAVLLLAGLAVWGCGSGDADAVIDGANGRNAVVAPATLEQQGGGSEAEAVGGDVAGVSDGVGDAAGGEGVLLSGQYAGAGDGHDVVQVTGTGKAVGVPDLAVLALEVSVTDQTVAAARSRAAAALQGVRGVLMENNIAARDIATSRFSIYPQHDYSQAEGRRLVGYTVSNGIRVKVRDTGSVGAIIDAAVAAGGNDIVFNDLSFGFSDTAAMEREAREAAVADLGNKAAQLAEFAGRELGDLKRLSEMSGRRVPFVERGLYAMAGSSEEGYETPVSAGEGEIAVTVYGVYELR